MSAECFGPYLRYAITTNFRDLRITHDYREHDGHRLMLIVEFNSGDDWDTFLDAITKLPESRDFQIQLGPPLSAEQHSRYATARCTTVAVTDAGAAVVWDTYASRVELSLPTKQAGIIDEEAKVLDRVPKHAPTFRSRVLIGMLDDGCPFAADRFLASDPALGTRVSAIWEQGRHEHGVQAVDKNGAACQFGRRPPDFQYGCEFLRDSGATTAVVPRQMGLNEWIDIHKTPASSVDEDACYADASFGTLRFRESHGAHVMDVLAGCLPTSSRISFNRLDPPTFAPASDPASAADIVFVQFPKTCIEDPSGVWLDAYVLDGVRYVLSCADNSVYDKVIINISYGRTTGPHNGSALLEEALAEVAGIFDGIDQKPELHLALAAGNYYLTHSHVVFGNAATDPVSFDWTWRLPPDNTALCFAELWMSVEDPSGIRVTLTSPSGEIFERTQSMGPAGLDGPVRWGRRSVVWRLQVEATRIGSEPRQDAGYPTVTAEYGDYKIKVDGVPANVKLHGYVARTDPNLDVLPGAEPSRFVDLEWERTGSAGAGCTYANGEFDVRGSFIFRFHTLNGIATAKVERIHVAGGYMLSNKRRSSYSSAGPARGDPASRRVGPDDLMLCDESYACEGIPAGGSRSGVVFRLIGTSAAAPQLARWIARGHLPNPTDPVPPEDVTGHELRGSGNLEPP